MEEIDEWAGIEDFSPVTRIINGVEMVFHFQDDSDESFCKPVIETEALKRWREDHLTKYPVVDMNKVLVAQGYEDPVYNVFGPEPRPKTIAQVKRQTFRKRTPQSIGVGGMYIVDTSDPKRPVKPITSQFPPNTDFGFTKHCYFHNPNPAADPSLVPGPASGTRSQVKRRRPLL